MSHKIIKVIVAIFLLLAIYPSYLWYWNKTSLNYFKIRCEQDAGEFIYRTVENVEGLFQMRPRDPRDYFTRLGEGDIPEDPYGHTNFEARAVEGLFLSSPKYKIPRTGNPYLFLETTRPPNAGELYDRRFPKTKLLEAPVITGDKYWRYEYYGNLINKGDYYIVKQIPELKSQYAYNWRVVRDKQDIKYDVWGGELIVKELKTDEVLGLKRGFFYQNKQTGDMAICPKVKNDTMVFDFVSKVLIPAESTNGEG